MSSTSLPCTSRALYTLLALGAGKTCLSTVRATLYRSPSTVPSSSSSASSSSSRRQLCSRAMTRSADRVYSPLHRVSTSESSCSSKTARATSTDCRPHSRPEQRQFSSKAHQKTTKFPSHSSETSAYTVPVLAYIALGSNVGNRLAMIDEALKRLAQSSGVRMRNVSHLYETEPMYVLAQDRFINGVCEIETDLQPEVLLDCLQAIENDMGRVKIVDKGPRSIDLDILSYGEERIRTNRLQVPHALMTEREFVLRPLCDLVPHRTFQEADKKIGSNCVNVSYADGLRRLSAPSTSMTTVTPLGPALALRALDPHRPTQIMSILNVTPDSFSDGGVNNPTDSAHLLETIKSHIHSGATIIDIGGQSSRPNAPSITADEEIARILPAIHAIKSLPAAAHTTISIDTYRAPVARAAIAAGAHLINDISAGNLDPAMLSTAAALHVPIVLMHMRGTPATMTSAPHTTYAGDLVATIAAELGARVAAALAAGVPRHRIVLDPGIGFAKTGAQNLELLRRFGELRAAEGLRGFPWLVGSSRKGFVGAVTGVVEARERSWGTAVTVAAAVQGGADVVRVHDVREMGMVGKMADAIWRV